MGLQASLYLIFNIYENQPNHPVKYSDQSISRGVLLKVWTKTAPNCIGKTPNYYLIFYK